MALHQMYPRAPIYVSISDKKRMGKFWEEFEDADIRVSWFQHVPFASRLISPLRFLLPLIWKSFSFYDYDLVISSAAWAVTKGFRRSEKTKEICYIHTPPRYLYGYDTSRKWNKKWYGWLVRGYALVVNHFMRMYDFSAAQRVDYFIANSKNTAKRVEKFYRRKVDAIVYPPVDIDKFVPRKLEDSKRGYYLTGGRLVASKNFDLVIGSFNQLNLPLKIYGDGLLRRDLERMSKRNIEFLGKVSGVELIDLYRGARAFVVAQKDEDFGITPVEAMAAGTPVIAYKGGGYEESVVDGATGIFFEQLNKENLSDAIRRFEKMKFDAKDCVDQARKFSKERFEKEVIQFVEEHA